MDTFGTTTKVVIRIINVCWWDWTNWCNVYQELEKGLWVSGAPHIIGAFVNLGLSLTQGQAQEVVLKMIERLRERRERNSDLALKEINRRSINRINWIFRASNRGLNRTEKDQAVAILNELKYDSIENIRLVESRTQRLQNVILSNNNDLVRFRQELTLLWL